MGTTEAANARPGWTQAKDAEIRASFARQGLLRAWDAEIESLDYGRCSLALPFSDAVCQQHGLFHGAAIGAIADVAAGYASMSVLDAGIDVLTLEYKINFLRPAAGRRLVARAEVLKPGRSVVVARGEVHVVGADGSEKLCAAFQQSTMPSR